MTMLRIHANAAAGRSAAILRILQIPGRALAIACTALVLGGCAAVGPDYQRPAFDLPSAYPESDVAGQPLAVPVDWWTLYRDPTLDKLVSAGLKDNTDVRLAIARLEEAEALVREAGATLLPEIDLNADAGRSRTSTRAAPLAAGAKRVRNNFLLSANTSFELDFWGRLRRARESVRAQYIASTYARDVVGLTLAAGITQTYFTVRSIDAQIVASRQSLQAAVDSFDIARQRAQAGVASDLDVNQADTLRAQIAAQITELQRQRAVAVHQLGVLTGTLSLAVEEGDLRVLPMPPLPPAGLPSTLLERRPDVRQAEAEFAAANADIGVARAAQLPTFSLTGALGTQSQALGTLFASGAGIWSIGIGVVGPILDWGRYEARTQQAEARAKQAAANYEKTAQTAFREIADALSNVRLAGDAERDLQTRLDRAANTLKLATQRYQSGYSAYIEVLDAQRSLNDAQLALIRNRQSYLGYTVDFMNALGGGWVPPGSDPLFGASVHR